MNNDAQVIRFEYAGKQYWLQALRFTTDSELAAALAANGVDRHDQADLSRAVYAQLYNHSNHIGKVFLLDKGVGSLAGVAVSIALHTIKQSGLSGDELLEELTTAAGGIVDTVTSQLYSRSTYF